MLGLSRASPSIVEERGDILQFMKLTFLGAAGTVTGSRYLVETEETTLLVDCGLFQGLKPFRERNWKPPGVDPARLDAVLLTHAHIDHSGYLPALVRDGFTGPIWTTSASRDLCAILLPDSGRIQEEDARYANEKGISKHSPALPLYTQEDAEAAVERIRVVRGDQRLSLGDATVEFRNAGHIPGASSVEITVDGRRVLFSGDLGRDDDLLITPPADPGAPDWVILDSTYGDRLHPPGDVLAALAEPLRRTIERGGVVLIPAFAVGRTQALLFALYRLFETGAIPRVPVHVDSPMASDVTQLYLAHPDEHRLTPEECRTVFGVARYTRDVKASKAINRLEGPHILLSASGMLTGGRVLHHLKVYGSRPNNLILLPGFQAPGTRGAVLAAGERELRVHGRYLGIEAEVEHLSHFSAHADQRGLVEWLSRSTGPVQGVYLVHGEPPSLESLQSRIAETTGWPVQIARDGESVVL